jgi:hypothetical protein
MPWTAPDPLAAGGDAMAAFANGVHQAQQQQYERQRQEQIDAQNAQLMAAQRRLLDAQTKALNPQTDIGTVLTLPNALVEGRFLGATSDTMLGMNGLALRIKQVRMKQNADTVSGIWSANTESGIITGSISGSILGNAVFISLLPDKGISACPIAMYGSAINEAISGGYFRICPSDAKENGSVSVMQGRFAVTKQDE